MIPFEKDILNSLQVLKTGGIILYPTDTIWGIGGDATNAVVIKKIYQLKKREEKKSLIILVSDENMITGYVKNPSEKILSFISGQRKPTTAIFENAINLPSLLINEDGTIAIRLVKDDFCKQLILQFKKPIISTSANISGQKFPESYSQITGVIKNGVDYIVQYRQQEGTMNTPSSIIKLNSKGVMEKIR